MVHWKTSGLFGVFLESLRSLHRGPSLTGALLESTEDFCDLRGLLTRPTLNFLMVRLHTKNITVEGKRPFWTPLRFLRTFVVFKKDLWVFAD